MILKRQLISCTFQVTLPEENKSVLETACSRMDGDRLFESFPRKLKATPNQR